MEIWVKPINELSIEGVFSAKHVHLRAVLMTTTTASMVGEGYGFGPIAGENSGMIFVALNFVLQLAQLQDKPENERKTFMWQVTKDTAYLAAFTLASSAAGAGSMLLGKAATFLQSLGPLQMNNAFVFYLTYDKDWGPAGSPPDLGMYMLNQRETYIGFGIVWIMIYQGDTFDFAPIVNRMFRLGADRKISKILEGRDQKEPIHDSRSANCKMCCDVLEVWEQLTLKTSTVKKEDLIKAAGCDEKYKSLGDEQQEQKHSNRCKIMANRIVNFNDEVDTDGNKINEGILQNIMGNHPKCVPASTECQYEWCSYKNACAVTLLSVSCNSNV